MTDSGASTVFGSGVTRAIAAAALARCPAYGPASASSRSVARSSIAMNVQRWGFLELPARRPASRIRSRCSGRAAVRGSGGLRACGRPRPRPSWARWARRADDCGVGTGRAGQGDPGEPPHAAALLDGRELLADVGQPLGVHGGGALGRLVRDTDRRARRPGSAPRFGDTPRTRTATSAARPGHESTTGAASGLPARVSTTAARSRSKWRSGTTASSSPCASSTGPSKAAMARIAADLGDTMPARPEEHAGREPRQRIRDRVGDRQVGEPERLPREAVRIRRVPRLPRAQRRAGPPRRRGSPRSHPSNGPRPLRWSPPAGEQDVDRGKRVAAELAAADREQSPPRSLRGRGRRTGGSGSRPRGGNAPSAASGREPTPSRGRGPRRGPAPPPGPR